MEWSSKQVATCIWLVEHLNKKSKGEEFGACESLPLKEKIKYIKNYVGIDKIDNTIKSKLTEEEVEKILFGYTDKKNYEESFGFDEEQVRFLQAILCWIGNQTTLKVSWTCHLRKSFSK